VNIHHLELFYYVATHRGINEAVRRIPYGIQQPAVSGQLLQLEASLELKLFQRRPFALTPAGKTLLDFVEPFFKRLPELEAQLRGDGREHLRLGAPALILRDHFPVMLERHRKAFPRMKVTLYDVNQAEAQELLQRQEIDLAITELEGKSSSGIQSTSLLKLPLVLLVPEKSRWRSARQFFDAGALEETLIGLPPNEVISKLFQRGLRKLGVVWTPSLEVTSLELIAVYVAGGFGVGISVAVPGAKWPTGVRALPLKKFPVLELMALRQNRLPPIAAAFLEEIKTRADGVRQGR
jgi:DNA-binding transcriptional LysR family regulator